MHQEVDRGHSDGKYRRCLYYKVLGDLLKKMVVQQIDPDEEWTKMKCDPNQPHPVQHVREKHEQDLLNNLQIVKKELQNYDKTTEDKLKEYDTKIRKAEEDLREAHPKLRDRKRLDQHVCIGRHDESARVSAKDGCGTQHFLEDVLVQTAGRLPFSVRPSQFDPVRTD